MTVRVSVRVRAVAPAVRASPNATQQARALDLRPSPSARHLVAGAGAVDSSAVARRADSETSSCPNPPGFVPRRWPTADSPRAEQQSDRQADPSRATPFDPAAE